MAGTKELVERLNGENPDKVVATDRLRMFAYDPDTFEFDQHDALSLIPTIEEAADALERLERERDEARGIVRDIHWMAVRYADNRKSYAVGMCNDALRKAYDGGWLVFNETKQHNLDPQYARNGLFDVEWRSAVDNATARAEAAESELATLRAHVARLEEALTRLSENIASFDAEVAFELSNEGERADLWTDIDVNVEDLRIVVAALRSLTGAKP